MTGRTLQQPFYQVPLSRGILFTRFQVMLMVEGNVIKEARIKAGLNIKELAELLGAPYRTVQEWNAGRHLPPSWMAKLIVAEIERRTDK